MSASSRAVHFPVPGRPVGTQDRSPCVRKVCPIRATYSRFVTIQLVTEWLKMSRIIQNQKRANFFGPNVSSDNQGDKCD